LGRLGDRAPSDRGVRTHPMIDTHCHLLWRVDDGPRSALESVALARALVEQGVTVALCTPHYSPRFPTGFTAVRERFDELTRDLAELDLPLRIELAAEVAHRLALSVPLDEVSARSIGGYVVVELEADAPLDAPPRVVERLSAAGLLPILAHPERSRLAGVTRTPLEEARAAGALVQVVASSLAGRRGRRVRDAAWSLLDSGCVDLLASDAHAAGGSVVHLREIVEEATRRYGEAAIRAMTEALPARILDVELASSAG
jgi:protein-tyrosine phosphatase